MIMTSDTEDDADAQWSLLLDFEREISIELRRRPPPISSAD